MGPSRCGPVDWNVFLYTKRWRVRFPVGAHAGDSQSMFLSRIDVYLSLPLSSLKSNKTKKKKIIQLYTWDLFLSLYINYISVKKQNKSKTQDAHPYVRGQAPISRRNYWVDGWGGSVMEGQVANTWTYHCSMANREAAGCVGFLRKRVGSTQPTEEGVCGQRGTWIHPIKHLVSN